MENQYVDLFRREPVRFVSKDSLTAGEQFLNRTPKKKPYTPSLLFTVLIGVIICVFVIVYFDLLPLWEVKLQPQEPEISMTNKETCQQFMEGKYMATADMFLYCQKLWPTTNSGKI